MRISLDVLEGTHLDSVSDHGRLPSPRFFLDSLPAGKPPGRSEPMAWLIKRGVSKAALLRLLPDRRRAGGAPRRREVAPGRRAGEGEDRDGGRRGEVLRSPAALGLDAGASRRGLPRATL